LRQIFLIIFKAFVSIFGGHGFGKFYPIKLAYDFVLKRSKSNFVIVLGHKMYLDSKDPLLLSINGIYEKFETMLMCKEIKRGNVVLDIGANIGYYTLIFAKLVGKNGKVYAFEPEPTNFSLLKKNVEINGYENVELVQKAVSNKNGKIKLYLDKENTADHRIYNSHDSRKFIEIESIKLDNYFKDHRKIDFIKMDVQGAECGVFQGMSQLLKNNKSMKIISEFWPIGLKRFGIKPSEYLKQLITKGFKIFEIDEQKKKVVQKTPIQLLNLYTLQKGNHTNLLCIKK